MNIFLIVYKEISVDDEEMMGGEKNLYVYADTKLVALKQLQVAHDIKNGYSEYMENIPEGYEGDYKTSYNTILNIVDLGEGEMSDLREIALFTETIESLITPYIAKFKEANFNREEFTHYINEIGKEKVSDLFQKYGVEFP